MNSMKMRIDVTIGLPGGRTPTTVALEVDGGEFDMSPMPRDRELPWAFDSRRVAERLVEERNRLARTVSRLLMPQIVEVVLEALAADDPVNGYDPHERLADAIAAAPDEKWIGRRQDENG